MRVWCVFDCCDGICTTRRNIFCMRVSGSPPLLLLLLPLSTPFPPSQQGLPGVQLITLISPMGRLIAYNQIPIHDTSHSPTVARPFTIRLDH